MSDRTDLVLVLAGAGLLGYAFLRRTGAAAAAPGAPTAPRPRTVREILESFRLPSSSATPAAAGKPSRSLTDIRDDVREWIERDPRKLTDLGKVADYFRQLKGVALADGLKLDYYWIPAVQEMQRAGATLGILSMAQSVARSAPAK